MRLSRVYTLHTLVILHTYKTCSTTGPHHLHTHTHTQRDVKDRISTPGVTLAGLKRTVGYLGNLPHQHDRRLDTLAHI
jgi:hypothetical protein